MERPECDVPTRLAPTFATSLEQCLAAAAPSPGGSFTPRSENRWRTQPHRFPPAHHGKVVLF